MYKYKNQNPTKKTPEVTKLENIQKQRKGINPCLSFFIYVASVVEKKLGGKQIQHFKHIHLLLCSRKSGLQHNKAYKCLKCAKSLITPTFRKI